MKNLINKIKEEIKSQAAEQRFIKSQRKTVNLVGERKISASEAVEQAQKNKRVLAIKYIAYYILKHGLEEPVFEKKIVSQYGFTRMVCTNIEAVKEAVSKCCGENSSLFKDLDVSYFHIDLEIKNMIDNWKKKYQEEEK